MNEENLKSISSLVMPIIEKDCSSGLKYTVEMATTLSEWNRGTGLA
jgi:hypothetical protein